MEEDINILMYLDDWLVQASSEAAALEATAVTLRLCGDLGFVFNIPKSLLSPTQTITWSYVYLFSSPDTTVLSTVDRRL